MRARSALTTIYIIVIIAHLLLFFITQTCKNNILSKNKNKITQL